MKRLRDWLMADLGGIVAALVTAIVSVYVLLTGPLA